MERTKLERARRARVHILDAVSRCGREEELIGWPLAYLLSEYLVRVLQGSYGRDSEAVAEFIREIAQRVEGGAWPSVGSIKDLQFEAAVSGFLSPRDEAADGE